MSKPSKKFKILVVGDSCKDIFVYCNCSRLCPESPVPLLDIIKEKRNNGMAGNVYDNIKSLGFSCDLLSNSNRDKVTKTRYVDDKTNHMFIRIDSRNKISRVDLKDVTFDKYDAVVISDYDKGSLTKEDIVHIGNSHHLVFLDTKKAVSDWAKAVTYIKINKKEYNDSIHFIESNIGLKNKVITTLGGDGCRFRGKHYPVHSVEVKDLSGAGDSFLAGLVCEYLLSDGNMDASLKYANKCASIVVQKKGVNLIKE